MTCGDGIRGLGEECDDRNTVSGDGCSSSCSTERGFMCTPSSFTDSGGVAGDYASDEKVQETIICPAGSRVEGVFTEAQTEGGCDFIELTDGVSGVEILKYSGTSMNVTGIHENENMFRSSSNRMAFTFTSDIGTELSGFNFDWTCIDGKGETLFPDDKVTPSLHDRCLPLCGDGKRVGKEQCDDGNSSSRDGCSSNCFIEEGFSCRPSPVSFVDMSVTMDKCLKEIGKSCSASSECDSHYCRERQCRAPVPSGAPCTAHEECGQEAFCDGSLKTCTKSLPLLSQCGGNNQCDSGSCFNHVCEPLGPLGAPCEGNSNCLSSKCEGGICIARENHHPCYIHLECISKYCEPDYDNHNLLNGTCLTVPEEVTVLRSLASVLSSTLTDWTEEGFPCQDGWSGITCNVRGRVAALKLSGRRLGALPGVTLQSFEAIDGAMPYLQIIDLPENQLTGTLPSWVNLQALQYVAFYNNEITGKYNPYASLPPSLPSAAVLQL